MTDAHSIPDNFKYSKIHYDKLTPKQKEIYNFCKISSILADYGFNCIKLSDDWNGADFIAIQMQGEGDTLKVQLKGRAAINKKYIGKDIWIAFPTNNEWYLVPHDYLVSIAEEATDWLVSKSWTDKGDYHSGSPPVNLIGRLDRFRL